VVIAATLGEKEPATSASRADDSGSPRAPDEAL